MLSFLSRNSITKLFQTFSSNAKLRGDCLLRLVVGEKDERREGCIGVALFVDPPHDVVEEWLEMDRDYALGEFRFVESRKVCIVAGRPVWRFGVGCARPWIEGSCILRVCLFAVEIKISRFGTSNRHWVLVGAALVGRLVQGPHSQSLLFVAITTAAD
jgi:hypothetical protein